MIFPTFEMVLSELEEIGIDEHEDEWEKRVESRLNALDAYYGNKNLLKRDRPLIDYGDIDTQAAYIFMYAVGRADFAYQLLKKFRKKVGKPIFPSGSIKVTSIGGGPGSELVGLIKYLEEDGSGESVTSLTYRILDKEENWEHVAEILINKIDSEIPVTLEFEEIDVCDEDSCESQSLQNDDLIILSFFISEVCEIQDRQKVVSNLNKIFRTLKVGSHVFYNDSDAYSFYTFMNGRARAVRGLTEIHEVQETISVSSPDLSGAFEEYMERFGKTPHLNSKAVSKFYRREKL